MAGYTVVEQFLKRNDFSDSYIEMLLKSQNKDGAGNTADGAEGVLETVMPAVKKSIPVVAPPSLPDLPKLQYFVGTSGSGKTATLLKLATKSVREAKDAGRELRTCLVSADLLAVAAAEKLEKIGAVMGMETFRAANGEGLEKIYAENKDRYDLFFVDTASAVPGDLEALTRVKEFLPAHIGAEIKPYVYLCLAATTKYADLLETLRAYSSLGFDSVIVTRCDETRTVGNVISALHDCSAAASYMTDGPEILNTIHKASEEAFVKMLRT